MRIWGLTGGIGSGKSEVAKILGESGIPVIDADAIGHQMLEVTSPGFTRIVEAFGEQILSGGAIDREKLATLVFTDGHARQRLNSIVHPLIQAEVARRCADLAEQGHAAAVIEAALLGEGGAKDPFLSGIILVVCPEDVRLRRLEQSRNMTREEALRRIAAQTAPERKLALADHVIDNSGDLHALKDRVLKLAGELVAS